MIVLDDTPPPPSKPHRRTKRPLSLWTVYERPRDYPEGFIARRFDIGTARVVPTMDVLAAPTLLALRARLPAGLIRLERDHADDPAIVETWL